MIKGFAPGDTIDLPQVQYNFREFTQFLNWQSNQLKIYATGIGGPVYQLQFDPSQNFYGDWFELSPDASGGTEIQLVAVNDIQINVVENGDGYGTLSATVNGQIIPGMQGTVSVAYDSLMPVRAGNYQLFYRTNSGPKANRDALEFDTPPGQSALLPETGVQIHVGNTPGDSTGCIVFGDGLVNGVSDAGSLTAMMSFFDSITSAIPYQNAAGFYPSPVPINVHVTENTNQPSLEVIPTSLTLAQGAQEKITFAISGLQSPSLNTDKAICVYFKVLGTAQTSSLISGAALTSVSLVIGQQLVGGPCYVVKIPAGNQLTASGVNSYTVTLNTVGVTSTTLTILVTQYDGFSYETLPLGTIGKVATYIPSGEPMLSGTAPVTVTLSPPAVTVGNTQTLNVASNQSRNGILDLAGGVGMSNSAGPLPTRWSMAILTSCQVASPIRPRSTREGSRSSALVALIWARRFGVVSRTYSATSAASRSTLASKWSNRAVLRTTQLSPAVAR